MKRIANGTYSIQHGDRTVTITRYSKREGATFNGWIAAADWDRYLMTDPLPTLALAKFNALDMLARG